MTNEIDTDLPIRLAGIIPIMFPWAANTLRKEAVSLAGPAAVRRKGFHDACQASGWGRGVI
jgi:hypothetical protein